MTRGLLGDLGECGLTENPGIAKSSSLIPFNKCIDMSTRKLKELLKQTFQLVQINQITIRKTFQIAKIQNNLETKICRRCKKRP